MPDNITTRCCIAGGGPAGMMLGYLLARAGIDVIVLEKHADFLRDFRGDTIHPSTLELMYELGVLDEFLKRPHQELRHLTGLIGDTAITIADFSHLPTHCRFAALMPQWDFLNFIAEQAKRYSGFRLLMKTEAVELIKESDRIAGVRASASDDLGAPMDVLWMRIPRHPNDSPETFGHVDAGQIMVMLNRDDYWQCALVIPKGGFEDIQRQGFGAFQERVARLAQMPVARTTVLRGWDDVKLLTVTVDRLRQWYRPGLLCIGDAAHAMSPIGGVGINLAVQDAVAAANILAAPLAAGRVSLDDLAAVQKRRSFPTRATQWLQVTIQNRIIRRVLAGTTRPAVPWPLRLLGKYPILQRIPARLVGVGFRPEHVRTPDVAKSV